MFDKDARQLRFQLLEADSQPLVVLRLSRRAYNALFRAGIKSVGQLAGLSVQELLAIRSLGTTLAGEIDAALDEYAGDRGSLPSAQLPPKERAVPYQDEWQQRWHPLADDPTPLPALELPRRVFNPLFTAGYQQIRYVASTSRDRLLEVPHFGLGGLAILEKFLTEYLLNHSHSTIPELATIPTSPENQADLPNYTLTASIDLWLEVLEPRDKEVIELRRGLRDAPSTLEEIGRKIERTRERVRQIEKRATLRLFNRYRQQLAGPIHAYTNLLYQELRAQAGIMSLQECVEWMELETVMVLGAVRPEGVIQLLCEAEGRLTYVRHGDLLVLNTQPIDHLSAILKTFVDILVERKRPIEDVQLIATFRESNLYDGLMGWQPPPDGVPLDKFIAGCIRTHPELDEIDPGRYGLRRWHSQVVDEVVDALYQIGEPAHYSVIAEWVNMLLPADKRASTHNVHALMGRLPELFVRVGHGVYGLAEWGLVNDGNLANAAVRVIEESGGPLHVEAITEEVLKTWRVRPGSVLAAVLSDERFVDLGQGVYALRSQLTIPH